MAAKKPRPNAKPSAPRAAPAGSIEGRVGELQRLIDLMQSAGIVELEMETPGQRVRVRMKEEHAGLLHVAGAPVVAGGGVPQARPASEPAAAAAAPPAAPAAAARAEGHAVESPMVGTFYRASSPDADPFVRLGQRVTPETTLCIIEAMKVMNEIKAEVEGEILEILVENGEPVEFGQPLFVIKV
jgi:acetyl-CoA carboxylase biotin carboxyl carrier protein